MKISSEKRCNSCNFLDKSTAVQIPVDACPTFVLKRRSFSFVIDKKQPQPRLFLYTGESVRLNKNAHCFAVEPSRLSETCRRHTSRRRHIAFAKGKNIVSSLLYGALPGDCHASYASLLTSQLSQATNACLMLSYSFPPKVQKYLLGTPSLLAMTFFYPQRAKGKNIVSSHLHARFFCFFAKEKPSEIRTVFCCLDLLFFVDQCFVDIIAFC